MHSDINCYCEICGNIHDSSKECYYKQKWWHKCIEWIKNIIED